MNSQTSISPPVLALDPDPVRQRVLAAAREHFFAHGFRGVTMDDLAAELGMSKKTLYKHFRSKQELLEALMALKFQEVSHALDGIVFQPTCDFSQTLLQLLSTLQKQMVEIQPPFVRDVRRELPVLFQLVQQRRRGLIEKHFGQLLTTGLKMGKIRGDLPTSLLLELLLGLVDSIANPTKLAELQLTPQQAFSAILNVFLHGVVVGNGKDAV